MLGQMKNIQWGVMKVKKPSGGSDFNDTESIPIDFTTLLTDDISSSGSFYVKGVQTTSLGKLLQALPTPALLIDQAYRISFANQACGRISPAYEKIVGTQISELLPYPAQVGDVERVVEEVFSTRKPQVHQALLGIENNRIWGRMYFRSLRVAEERLILLLIEDLTLENLLIKKYRDELTEHSTERRQAEQALRETQERLELVLAGGQFGYWDWDIPNDYLISSSYWSDVLGYPLDETKRQINSWKSLLHPEDMAQVMEVFNANLEGRIPAYVAEYRLLAKSGEWEWVMARGKVVERDAHGRPLRMAGIFVDITDRKRAEQALRESEQRFRAIFEGAKDYISLKDRSLRYMDVNPAVEKLFGIPKSEIIGRRYNDLFGKEGSKQTRETDSRVLEGEAVEGEQTRNIYGIPRTFLYTKSPLRDGSGEVIGILSISREITERKRLEVSCAMGQEYPSQAMRSTLKSAILEGKSATTVLLTGESGSGKDYLARYIHDHSDSASGPYFSVNCAAISEGLAESELFGHERGSFTGAVGRKRGLLELAQGGTLLLNEIGELSLPLQSKLLTFLDTRKFTRVGGEKEIKANAKIIAATNRDLEREVEEGRFRKDLFYRLNVFSIATPPLRERREDIPVLVQEILSKLRSEMEIDGVPTIDASLMTAFEKYDWPGNVRELHNVLERVLIHSRGKELHLTGLEICELAKEWLGKSESSFTVSFPSDRSLNEITRELKRFFVDAALQRSAGSRKDTARLLGISRDSLKHYMKSLGHFEEE
jgi:PAS domain S-box-containing protein